MNDSKPCILIVDDEKQTSRTMAMALEAVGYQTQEEASADEGLKFLSEHRPGLIILDYHMQNKDGVTMLKELRQHEWGQDVPVIVASNIYDVDIINEIMSLGVQDYVLKSDINLEDIVKLVGTYVPLNNPSA